MKNIMLVAFFMLVIAFPVWAKDGPLKVVATQSIYAELAKQIGADKVQVQSIASPKFNVHFIQPKPSDVRKVSKADLYVSGGLDLEAWSDPLLEAAGKPALFRKGARHVDLSLGLRLLDAPQGQVTRGQGDIHVFGNPHIQMSPENIKIMVGTLSAQFKEIDPANVAFYEAQADRFLLELNSKIVQWKTMCRHCQGQEILSYHEDIAYLADFLGVKVEEYLEVKPGIPPSPKHLQRLEEYARKNKVKAIVMPTYFPKAHAQRLADRLGIKVVTIAQGAGELPGTENIFNFFDYNMKQLSEALQ